MLPTTWPIWVLQWLFAGFALLGGGLAAWALFGDRAKGRKRCPKCWYDMSVSPGLVCPECGHDARNAKRLMKTRRRTGLAWSGVALVLLAAGIAVDSHRRRLGWAKLVPSSVLFLIVDQPDYGPLRWIMGLPPSWGFSPTNPPQGLWEELRATLSCELAQRHVMGELPTWVWHRLARANFVIPPGFAAGDPMIRTWPRGLPLSILLDRKTMSPAGVRITQIVQLKLESPSWSTEDVLPGDPFSIWLRFPQAADLPLGETELQMSLEVREQNAAGESVEIWSGKRTLTLQIVETSDEARSPVSGPEIDAIAATVVSPTFASISGIVPPCYTIQSSLQPRMLPGNIEAAPFIEILVENEVIATIEEVLVPFRPGGLTFRSSEMMRRFAPQGCFPEPLDPRLRIRISGIPPDSQLWLDSRRAYWSGRIERSLLEFKQEFDSTHAPAGNLEK